MYFGFCIAMFFGLFISASTRTAASFISSSELPCGDENIFAAIAFTKPIHQRFMFTRKSDYEQTLNLSSCEVVSEFAGGFYWREQPILDSISVSHSLNHLSSGGIDWGRHVNCLPQSLQGLYHA
jgi:hypothetical protein